MAGIDDLLFKREQFPITIESPGKRLPYCLDRPKIKNVPIPPYHPDLKFNGIRLESVAGAFPGAFEAVIEDLESIKQEYPLASRWLAKIRYDTDGTLRHYDHLEANNEIVRFDYVPLIGNLTVGKDRICHEYRDITEAIFIDKTLTTMIRLPRRAEFKLPILEEYFMREQGAARDDPEMTVIRLATPYSWYVPELSPLTAIFFKNMVIALDNQAVRRKYQGTGGARATNVLL